LESERFRFRNKKWQSGKEGSGRWAAGTLRKPESRAGKSRAMAAFRVISRGHLARVNFCAFANIFRNPVTGNASRVREAILYKCPADKVKDSGSAVPKWDFSKPTVFT
jgi:hypothetical protein